MFIQNILKENCLTEQEYLNDTYLFNTNAQVIETGKDDNGQYLIFDKTIFYPQGGGQPSDIGKINADGKLSPINMVQLIDNKIKHYGDFTGQNFQVGDKVEIIIDKDYRLMNARNHTSGHLISMVVDRMDIGLNAVKGYHFPEGSYVEFTGKKPENKEELIKKLNENLKNNIDKKFTVVVKFVPRNELIEDYGMNLDYIKSDSIRVVMIDDYRPIPCGGTHIKSLEEIKDIVITKIKYKKSNIRLSYNVS